VLQSLSSKRALFNLVCRLLLVFAGNSGVGIF